MAPGESISGVGAQCNDVVGLTDVQSSFAELGPSRTQLSCTHSSLFFFLDEKQRLLLAGAVVRFRGTTGVSLHISLRPQNRANSKGKMKKIRAALTSVYFATAN